MQFRQRADGIRDGGNIRRVSGKPLMTWPPGTRNGNIDVKQRQLFAKRKRRGAELAVEPQIERFSVLNAIFLQLFRGIRHPAFRVICIRKGGIDVRHKPDEQALKLLALGLPYGRREVGTSVEHPLIVSIVISVANDQPLGVAAILALLLTMIGGVRKQRDAARKFSLLRAGGALKAGHGLTSLTTRTVPVRRVQAVEVSTPLLWRPLGVSRITMTVLGGAGLSDVEQSTVLLPIGDDEQVRAALDALWPGFRLDSVHLNGIPKRARWFRWFDQTVIAWGFDDEVVVTRKGLFNRTLSIVPHARSQSVRLAQGPLQRRLGLADVYVHTSSGPVPVSCSHLDVTAARTFAIGQMDRTRAARARELSPTEHPATGVATRQELPALS